MEKKVMFLILFAGAVALGVIHFPALAAMVLSLLKMVRPFLAGGCIAFAVNLILVFLEKRVFKGLPGWAAKFRRPLGIFLSFLLLILIVLLVMLTVIPQLAEAITALGQKIPVFWNKTLAEAELLMADYPQAAAWIRDLEYRNLDWESILGTTVDFLKRGVGSLLNSTFNVAGNLLGGLVSGLISLIFSIYILSQKEKLGSQFKTLIRVYCKEKTRENLLHVMDLLYRNFSKFITGQCTEAVILGILFILVMTITGMPYAFMIGVLIGFTSLIPIVGAFIGCFVGAFMILVEDPIRALWFIALFLVIQQLEGNLIYPRVVGNSVGLPSIWVLVAVSLGSSLFGVVGMLVFIPLFATGYMLIREDVDRRQKKSPQDVKKEQNDQ